MSTDLEKTATAIEQELGAAFIAGGVSVTVLGVMTTLAEISQPLRESLVWFNRGGPLGGKTSLAMIAFILSWGILIVLFKKHPLRLNSSFIIALALTAAGILLTFPPIFKLLASLWGA